MQGLHSYKVLVQPMRCNQKLLSCFRPMKVQFYVCTWFWHFGRAFRHHPGLRFKRILSQNLCFSTTKTKVTTNKINHTWKSLISISPAQPKARWYLEVGLNLTQQTLALASMLATELSRLVDHNLTEEEEEKSMHKKKKNKGWYMVGTLFLDIASLSYL